MNQAEHLCAYVTRFVVCLKSVNSMTEYCQARREKMFFQRTDSLAARHKFCQCGGFARKHKRE